MNVLSLFDGMSCGQLALTRLGITPFNYYASEIDKYAIQVTQHNYSSTIQLGDIRGWESWNIDWAGIDLIFAGFPCQAWSVAGRNLGDRDERGMLFWTMLDVIKRVMFYNPNVKVLIENVKMKSEFEQYITYHVNDAIGHVDKHLINSSLVSAHHRTRYYWTNIEGVTAPKDRGISLQSIIEHGFVDRKKSYCIDANYFKGGNLKSYFEKRRRQLVFLDEDFTQYRKLTPLECERLQTVPENYTSTVSNTQRYKMLGNGWTVDVISHILSHLN